jgi:hypothetical protein
VHDLVRRIGADGGHRKFVIAQTANGRVTHNVRRSSATNRSPDLLSFWWT